jgi:hypothetical protein
MADIVMARIESNIIDPLNMLTGDDMKLYIAQIDAEERAMKEAMRLSPLSYSERMHLNKFSLSDIERLFMALSLFISAEDRPAYDAVLTTWINDRYAEMGTRYGK